jgi:hypothetical protein
MCEFEEEGLTSASRLGAVYFRFHNRQARSGQFEMGPRLPKVKVSYIAVGFWSSLLTTVSRQIEMSPFARGFCGVHVILRLPVKRRSALLASNPIEE